MKTTKPTTDGLPRGAHLTSRIGLKPNKRASADLFSDTGKVRVDNLHYELTEDDITVSALTTQHCETLT